MHSNHWYSASAGQNTATKNQPWQAAHGKVFPSAFLDVLPVFWTVNLKKASSGVGKENPILCLYANVTFKRPVWLSPKGRWDQRSWVLSDLMTLRKLRQAVQNHYSFGIEPDPITSLECYKRLLFTCAAGLERVYPRQCPTPPACLTWKDTDSWLWFWDGLGKDYVTFAKGNEGNWQAGKHCSWMKILKPVRK